MICHLLTVLSLITYFHVAHSAITEQQMLVALKQFSDDLTWPRIKLIAAETNYAGFTPDGMSAYVYYTDLSGFLNANTDSTVIGSVDVTNVYEGRELNTEYVFGLFASLGDSNTTRFLGVPGHGVITELTINPPVLSFSTLRDFDWGAVTIPVQLDVWLLFDNDSGLVAQYDMTFRRLEWACDYVKPFLLPQLVKELGPLARNTTDVDDLMHLRAAIDICQQHDLYCTGSLQQYNSTRECIDFNYRQKPMGKVYEWGGDNAMCRWIHKGMIPYRPSIHCQHIGPSGGGMCIKRDYINETTQNPYPTPFLPPELVGKL